MALGSILVAAALLYVGCRGSGTLAQGGMVWEGDDVIVVTSDTMRSASAVHAHVERTLGLAEIPVETANRTSGYLRTEPLPVNDTISIRLNIAVIDTGRVEIAGDLAGLETSSPEKRQRIAWNETPGRGTGVWSFMTDVGTAIGTVEGYERDTQLMGSFECGGRRCAEEEVCEGNVCRSPDRRTIAEGDEPGREASSERSSCISNEERSLIDAIRTYRASENLPEVPISKALTKVARLHVRDLAEHAPHESGGCNLHSWSDEGSWSGCCYTEDHDNASCMWEKPSELTNYVSTGYEIVYQGPVDAERIMDTWQRSAGHDAVLANRGQWRDFQWSAMGIGAYDGYAVVWFGTEEDTGSTPSDCER